MNVVKLLIILVLAYLMGSLSSSILLSRGAWGGDVRSKGSGNAGATNMARVFGWGAGLLTLVCDMAKAGLSVWIGWKLMGDWGLALGGIACMAGHCFPLFHEFKGGKGISVGAALGLAIDWRVFVAIVVVFLIVALLTRKVSAGSCAAAVAITAASLVFTVGTPKLLLAITAMCLALFQHRGNLKRLAAGTEPDFKAAETDIFADLFQNPAVFPFQDQFQLIQIRILRAPGFYILHAAADQDFLLRRAFS